MENSWTETDRRQFERHPLMIEAQVTIGGKAFAAVIFDISAGGAKLQLKDAGNAAEIAAPKSVVLDIPDYGDYEGDVVWTDDDFIGIDFHESHKTMVKLITGQSAVTAA
ncbi:MAG: PilZ domain-containing protein [Proteobacteria bacterium]|nr:PilZ domain-containing protein [Pseudomonadota bacterium]